MQRLKKLLLLVKNSCGDSAFLGAIEQVEGIVSKILSIVMIAVIFVAMFDLIIALSRQLMVEPFGFFNESLFEIFGLFLNVLIALEILENITAYLRKHVVQVELVIVTSLIAVARKIIILNLDKTGGLEIIGLALAILSLSISYWIIRRTTAKKPH